MNFNTDAHEAQEAKKKPQPQIQVVCSGILRNKDGEKVIYVRFERGKDFAEGSIPAAKITSHQGFFTKEALRAIAETTLQNASDYESGKESPNDVK